MNAHKTDGFTVIETLASIVLILVITITMSTALITILRNNDNASMSLHESWLILNTDQELREKIEPVVFPYWENSMNAARLLRQQIINETTIPGVTILGAEIIVKNGAAHGLQISYSISDRPMTYTSIMLFSSIGDAIKR